MTKPTKLSLFAATICAAAFAPTVAHASIAKRSCQPDESRLPERIAAATDIVLAKPLKITYTDKSGERTITATYQVTGVGKGANKVDDTIKLTTTCRLASTWSDFRGYPSSWCGRDVNNSLPGFDGTKPITTAGALLIANGQLVHVSEYGPCPTFDPNKLAAIDATFKDAWTLLQFVPEMTGGAALPLPKQKTIQSVK